MSSKTRKLRLISLFWDYVSALSLIALLFLLWNLSKGPIEVNFLKPYIEQALTSDEASYDLKVGSVNLELVHSVQPIKIIAKDVIFEDKEELYQVKAPRLALSFSARALLKGFLAPSSVNIERPYIELKTMYGIEKNDSNEKENVRDANLKKLEFYFEQFEEFLERFNSGEKLYMESFINSIVISDATLLMNEVDMNRQFMFEDMDLSFNRFISDIKIKLDSAVRFEDRISAVDMMLKYKLYNDEVVYEANFSDLVITDLYSSLFLQNDELRMVDIPVNGKFNVVIDFGNILKDKEHFADNIGKNIKEVGFSIEGGKGKIGFGQSKEFDYEVSSFNLDGKLYGGLDKVSVENALFDFGDKQAKLSLSAQGFKDYFLKGDLDNFKVKFIASLGAFDMDELSKLWPKYLGEKAWNWCKESLYGGEITSGKFTFDFGMNEKTKEFGLLNLAGEANIVDANLDYLSGMPVIKNVYGTAYFQKDKIAINVDKGVSDGVILTGGKVVLYDLDKDDNFILIDLKGNSTIKDALYLIDNEPLGFTKEMGIDPNEVAGDVDIDLKLDFELKSDIKPEEIKVEVRGDLFNVEYLGLEEGKTFVADKLKLLVTEKGFSLDGIAKYQGIELGLELKEDFKNNDYKSRIVADIKINDEILKKLGVDSEILAKPYFTGNSDIKAIVTFLNDGKINLEVDGDLKNTDIDYAFLGFAKPKGVNCNAKANMIINDGLIEKVNSFSINKAQFEAKGNISMDNKGRISVIDVTNVKSLKTFAKAKVDFLYEPKLKLKVTVTGDSYDLTDFFEKKKDDTKNDKKMKKKSLKDPLEDMMDTDIVIGVNKLWTNDKVPVTNFAGKAYIRNKIGLYKMNMVGNYGNSKDVKMKLDFEPRGEDFILLVDSNNAGSTLKVLRLYDNMKGGNLKIEAKRDKYRNLKGYAKMRDFSLENPPIFAKVLRLASLSGIVDMLRGEGLTFTHLNMLFSYTFSNKVLEITEAKMFGSVLGVTIKGTYDLFSEIIEARGMVIPAYGLNTFIGNIPLVGKILAGKDGSVFATNYEVSGTIEKPEININPLSTLAPNSVKELFLEESQ